MEKKRVAHIPKNYVPKPLSPGDRKLQEKNIKKSREAYKKGRYLSREKVKSFHSRRSPHIVKAEKIYKEPDFEKLVKKVPGCRKSLQKEIIKKGKGAFFSSGSRPNQTPSSWSLARLASAITGGKAARVDHKEIEDNCKASSKAVKLLHKNFPGV